jgi:hypothetical protein
MAFQKAIGSWLVWQGQPTHFSSAEKKDVLEPIASAGVIIGIGNKRRRWLFFF